nr:G-type lectin S-receptor-like serine/threonine-protein kinase At2g19130 [Ipomoea batatas]
MDIRQSSSPVYYFLFLCFSLSIHISHGAYTTSVNQSLFGDQTIVSPDNGKFELGFFKPGTTSNYYIGIWYKVSPQTVVWVANRETPISNKASAELKILDGNLVLLNEFKTSIWNTSISSTSKSVTAVLHNDGNLILSDGSNSTSPLWQSFDNPTDTWLPGGRLSYNKRTRTKQLLISWRNSEDPAPGLFSLELDPENKQYLLKWNKTDQYWTAGPWNDHTFSEVPEMRLNYLYNFTYEDNHNESYFTYSLYDNSVISRFVLGLSGQIQQLSWLNNSNQWNMFWSQPKDRCQVYAYCGAFSICRNSLPFCNCLDGFEHKSDADWNRSDFSGGCVRETALGCGNNSTTNGAKDKFKMYPQMALPKYAISIMAGSAAECESYCLGNCSCSAYAYRDSDGCSIWNGELLNLQQLSEGDGSGRTIYIRLAASEFPSDKSNNGVPVGFVVGPVAGALLVLCVIFFALRKWRGHMFGTAKIMEGSLVVFGYKELQSATKNFSEKLGGGGFGSVFKGALPDSSVIAVKKLESISQGEKQFRTETIAAEGNILTLLDPRLQGVADIDEASRTCKVALWCIQDEEKHRPSMGQVAQILEGVLDVGFPPIPRSLELFANNQETIVFFTEPSSTRSSSHSHSTSSNASSQTENNPS